MLNFPGYTNVLNLNIDRDVLFKKRSVSVYPDSKTKPPIGQGLNKDCIVTLLNIYPAKKSSRNTKSALSDVDEHQFINKLQEMNKSMDSRFLDYSIDEGNGLLKLNTLVNMVLMKTHPMT